MSIDQLQADIKDNKLALKEMGAMTTAAEIVAHLKNTLWPMLESIAEEMAEQDGCIEDLMNASEDILQPETGAKFLAFASAAVLIRQELGSRITANDDPKHRQALIEFDQMANDFIATVQEITIPDAEEEADLADGEDEDEDEEDSE